MAITNSDNQNENYDPQLGLQDDFVQNLIKKGMVHDYDSRNETLHYVLATEDQAYLMDATKAYADHLAQLHNMKPLNRKKKQSFKFAGRGAFSVMDTLLATINNGFWELKETRKVRVVKERPNVAILHDVSASMEHQDIATASLVLSATLIEFFGRGFADRFDLGFIGDQRTMYYPRLKHQEAKRELLKADFYQNTHFTPPLIAMDKQGFYQGKKKKYVFLLTDGKPETSSSGTYQTSTGVSDSDPVATHEMIQYIVSYIHMLWDTNAEVEFFWIQIGNLYRNEPESLSFMSFLHKSHYYPPEKEVKTYFDEKVYDYFYTQMNNTPTPPSVLDPDDTSSMGSVWQFWAYFLFQMYKKGNVVYLDVERFKDGSAFHIMMRKLMRKYREIMK